MSHLFTPFKLREVEFKHRIAVSPMCQYSSVDGFANDWHLVHLGSHAVGKAALVITEATAVSPEGRISPSDLGIWHDSHITMLKRITDFIHQQGSVAGIQLAHAGRKASISPPWLGDKLVPVTAGGWEPVGPSSIAFSDNYAVPRELPIEDIKKVIDDFRQAAQRALIAGFSVIEIHAAHGYLIHQFLSPVSNKRTDEYGGAFENRIRLLIEIIAAVRNVWPERYPLFVRISATDWLDTPDSWRLEDSIRLATILKTKGVDLIDCSSGGIAPDIKIPAKPNYQVPFADTIRNEAGIATGAVGIIVKAQQAEDIIAKGQADIVLMAREMLRDPYFPIHAAAELGYNIEWPVQYERAKRPNKS